MCQCIIAIIPRKIYSLILSISMTTSTRKYRYVLHYLWGWEKISLRLTNKSLKIWNFHSSGEVRILDIVSTISTHYQLTPPCPPMLQNQHNNNHNKSEEKTYWTFISKKEEKIVYYIYKREHKNTHYTNELKEQQKKKKNMENFSLKYKKWWGETLGVHSHKNPHKTVPAPRRQNSI